MLLGTTTLMVDAYQEDILEIPGGKEFLEAYDLVNKAILVYFSSRAILQTTQALPKLRDAFNRLKATDDFAKLKTTNPSKATAIEREVDDILKKGDEVAKRVDVPTGLVSKLTQQGSTKLKSWLSSKTLSYADNTGAKVSGTAAETKIFNDLDAAIGNKRVLETLEDGQGRLSVVLERPGQTNQVVSIHPTSAGDFKMTTFEPTYNPSLNPDIPAPASANRLVPDYSGTQYLHPDLKTYISNNGGKGVLIEMQGTRAKDFAEAFKKLGIKASDATDYTWHHFDDFVIINGKPHCTMQLVESVSHGGKNITGMAHSGSVAQWKAYFGISNYP